MDQAGLGFPDWASVSWVSELVSECVTPGLCSDLSG